jgi:hypothetical protein
MRQLWTIGLTIALILVAAAGCGSSETKTVTETVTSSASEAEAGSESESAESGSEGVGVSDAPTATTIPDGTWRRGEYTPGTYRAKGGGTCSWEKRQNLNEEAEGTGNWGGAESNVLAEIDSPYFVTDGCGVWEKVE